MMKRVLMMIALAIGMVLPVYAKQERMVSLDAGDNRVKSFTNLDYVADAKFEYLYPIASADSARVRMTFSNITGSTLGAQPVLIFNDGMVEKTLGKMKPKVKFSKQYSGDRHSVDGCGLLPRKVEIVIPGDSLVVSFNVSFKNPRTIVFPIYIGKCKKEKKLNNEQKYDTEYTLYEEIEYSFTIKVEGWTEEDPQYVKTKGKVDGFFTELQNDTFCPKGKHKKATQAKERKYNAERDELVNEIKAILNENSRWMSTDPAHIAYTALINRLQSVNVESYEKDCGRHGVPVPPKPNPTPKQGHHCAYCSWSSQQVYNRLDLLYKQLYGKSADKNSVKNAAKAIWNCYQQNTSRRKGSLYDSKIPNFYTRIMSY